MREYEVASRAALTYRHIGNQVIYSMMLLVDPDAGGRYSSDAAEVPVTVNNLRPRGAFDFVSCHLTFLSLEDRHPVMTMPAQIGGVSIALDGHLGMLPPNNGTLKRGIIFSRQDNIDVSFEKMLDLEEPLTLPGGRGQS
jgi:hypothetical protein